MEPLRFTPGIFKRPGEPGPWNVRYLPSPAGGSPLRRFPDDFHYRH